MTLSLSMDTLIDRFVAWAARQAPIRAAAIVGSRARTDRPADAWSDLDLVVIATDPQRYLMTTDWLAEIAVPHLTFLESTAVGNLTERRVLFDGARDVDFSFVPTSVIDHWHHEGLDDAVAHVVQRGVRLLFDKDSDFRALLARVPPRSTQPIVPPSAFVFTELVNDFLYHVLWCAKKLYRGELWIAKQVCDGYLKQLLLRMIEWHAQVQHQWQLDTWHGGRFLEHWAASEVLDALPATFAAYHPHGVERALIASLTLFHQLASAVAPALHYPYPDDAHAYVVTWLQQHGTTQETVAGQQR